MLKTLSSYLPSFALLTVFIGIYTAVVFSRYPIEGYAAQNQTQTDRHPANQSQNLSVAKKLKAEKPSTDTVAPLTVASPLETE